jgi:ATP-dependent DNA ligase
MWYDYYMETILYQKSASTGKGKIWIIGVDDKGTQSEIVIQSGQVDLDTLVRGKLVKNTAIVSVGKNIGKSNETTHYTQAVSEAQSKVDAQLRAGYVTDPQEAKKSSSSTLGSGVKQPMLAQKYHPTGAQKSSKTLKQMKIEGKKIIVQPKLDGNRCTIVVRHGDGNIMAQMYTRKGDLMPVQLNHIITDISVAAAYHGLKDELVLDGELYCDPTEMSFNELNGLIKKQSASAEQIERRKLIKFHLYDVMIDEGYEKRLKVIEKFNVGNVEVVESKEIIATDENIQKELERWLGLGYEGLMIRVLGKGYENKRSWQLVKVKIFEDAEFKLVGFEEDVRGGFVGTFVLELPTPVTDRDGKLVTEFRAGASGQSVEDRTYMLKHPEEFIGKMATIEFFGRSEYGIPRFGKFKGIREDI